MSKEFELKTNEREARPRSKRLRELHSGSGGTGGSTVINVTGGSSAPVEGHTHTNKYNLDQITTDSDGYLNLTQQKEIIDPETAETRIGSVTEKVKAGWADKAGIAHDLDPDSPVRDQFLSKLADDVAKGHITFEKGLTALITSYFKGGAHFGEFVKGLAGAIIDEVGNAEFESITARGYLKVFELIYNRLNAVEGNTSFADVGTIESIEDRPDGSQVLTMRKRWDGDFTAFQPGDVVYSYINNLNNGAASEHYKAWAWIKSVDRAANALTVVPYADSMVPAGVNHGLAASQIITRWGNNIEANAITWANPDYGAVIQKRGENDYVNVRQSTFYISCEDGNIVELMGVNKPILEAGNYGTVLGKMPAGLLDPATQELVNKDHPYLFARGIIVQDLIRMDYTGAITRTGNYRGTWSAATAASATDYYRSLPGTYDTVTWQGDLWQCITTGNTDEPSESSGNWVNMTGRQPIPTLDVWQILPNTDIVTLRYDGDKITIMPDAVTCQVLLTSTDEGTVTYSSNYDLAQKGVRLYYSLDGLTWKVFVIGMSEPLDLEDETGIIETEGDTPEALTLGGDDVSASEIGDRIYFELRNDTDVLARTTVPVVKDGQKGDKGDKGEDGKPGIQGRDGLMVYPDGYFNAEKVYTATSETAPVVMYGLTDDQRRFYVLKRGKTYSAAEMPDNRKTPAGDVAYGGEDVRWQVFDSFNAVFADILMAEFAKLASAVFYGDWMISQQGTRNGAASTEYRYFKDGTFTPNYAVNFKTGEIVANNATIRGTIDATSGKIGGFKIGQGYIGVDTDLSYADKEGMSLYPSFIKFSNSDWSHLAMIGTNVLPGSLGLHAQARFENTEQNIFGTNYGVLIYAENAENNIALAAKGNIISDSLCGSYGYRPIDMSANTVTHRPFDANTWVIKCVVEDSHIALPDVFDVHNKLGLGTSTPFSVRITIIAAAGNTKIFKIQGRNNSIKGSDGTKFLDYDRYPYRLDNNGNQQLADGLNMGAGDIAEFQLVFDGTTYNAYLLNYRT